MLLFQRSGKLRWKCNYIMVVSHLTLSLFPGFSIILNNEKSNIISHNLLRKPLLNLPQASCFRCDSQKLISLIKLNLKLLIMSF